MQKRSAVASPPGQPRRTIPPEGLIIEAEDMFLPGLSPSTLHDRLAEFNKMNVVGGNGGVHQSALLVTPTTLSPQPPAFDTYPLSTLQPHRLSLGSPSSTPPPESAMLSEGQRHLGGARFASTARSLARITRAASSLQHPANTARRPQFVEGGAGVEEVGDGFGLARIGSNLAPSVTAERRRSHFGVFERPFTSDAGDNGGDGGAPLEGRRKSSFRADDGTTAPPNFARMRRSSTFTHGAGPSGQSNSGLGTLEHQLFKSAPSAVLAKLSSFVNNRNGDGGSWERLSELMDMHRRGVQMSSELAPTTQRLKYAGEEYPHRIVRIATRRAEGGGGDDEGSGDDEGTHNNGGGGRRRRPRVSQTEMLSDWQDSIATAASLLNNLLGLVSNAVPALMGTCDAVRRVLLTSVYHNGRNLASVLPLPSSLDAAAAETDYSTLKKKMDLFSVDPFAIISVETDLKKLGAQGKGSDSLMNAVKTVRQLRRRYNTIMSFVTYNMSCWRHLAMGCILKSWRAARSRRLLEESQAVEINSLNAELEFLKSSKKTQQAELVKATTDRTAAVESAEVEKATLQETYERNAVALTTQVSNLKNLVQSMKRNTEVPLLKDEMAKLQDTNNQLEAQIVKLVEHINNKEGQFAALQQKQATLVTHIAALSRQVSAVSGHLSMSIQRNRTSLTKVAALGTGAASIPPLAQWVTDLAQNVMGEDAVYKALVAAMSAGNVPKDRGSFSMSAIDLSNASVRQGLVRVRDFSEGAAVLDAYACVLYALDGSVVSAADVAEVMMEADVLCKGHLVLTIANALFSHGTRTRTVGSFVRNPSSFLTSADLAFSSSVRPHILMVTSMLAVWMSAMCSVSLVAPEEDDVVFLSKPLLLESYLDSTTDPISVCSARWEQVKDCFVTWRSAVFALHSLLVDYTTEVMARGLTVTIPPLSSAHLKARTNNNSTAGSTPPSSEPSPSLPYLAQRRQSSLVRSNTKSAEERLLMGSSQSRLWVIEALRYALQMLVVKPSQAVGSTKRAPQHAAPDPPAGTDAQQHAVASNVSSEDERLQLTATAIVHRIEADAQRLVGVFQHYAVPTSESGAHNPVLVIGANEAVRLCADIGLLVVPTSTPAADAVGQHVQCITSDECREMILAIARKRGAIVASSSSPLKGSAATTPASGNKRLDDALRSAIQIEEFGGLLMRIAARWCAASNNSSTNGALFLPYVNHSSVVPGSSVSVSGSAPTPPGSIGSPTDANAATPPAFSVDPSGTPSSQGGVELNTPTPSSSKIMPMLEDMFGYFVSYVLMPRAFRVDVGVERSIRAEPSVACALEDFRPMIALLFAYCCGLPETIAAAGSTKKTSVVKAGGASARAVASQGQFKVWCFEVLSKPQLSAPSPVSKGSSAAGNSATGGGADAQPSPSQHSANGLQQSDAVFIYVQQLDVGKPLIMTLSDFLSALVALALVRNPSPLLHHAPKILAFFEDVLEPFAAHKFPGQPLRNIVGASPSGDAQQQGAPLRAAAGDEMSMHRSWDTSMSTDGGALLLGSGGVSQQLTSSISRPVSPQAVTPSKTVIG